MPCVKDVFVGYLLNTDDNGTERVPSAEHSLLTQLCRQSFLFCVFETGYFYVSLVVLELTM